jgi:antitoxin component HigA of HigAB toxin-antitoxin module
MVSSNPPPIRNQADFERALTEIERILEEPHELNSEDRYFAYLLGQVADYHESLTPERREPNQERLEDLERHLKAFGVHWPHPEDGDRHWSPALPTDLAQGRR